MARAPSVLLVQTNHQHGNKAQILGKEVHGWGRCSVTPRGKPFQVLPLTPVPTKVGRDEFCPQIWIQLVSTRMSLSWEQILACGMLGNHRCILQWWPTCQHKTGRPASMLYGNLARCSTSAPCCIPVADEHGNVLREGTESLWKLSPCGCAYDCMCVLVSLYS